MSAYKNIAFGLRMRKVDGREIERRVQEAARVLGLTDELLAKKPKQLSGGQRQRVAMGRAIVRSPRAFLMDEPLSNLDAKLRVEMRAEIARLQRELGVTTIYVTHDQTEAMMLGHQLVLLNEGVLQQVGPPQDVYSEPANLFVAGFIGSPSMNFAEADLVSRDGVTLVEFGGQRLRAPEELSGGRPELGLPLGGKVIVGIRPEEMEDASLVPEAPPDRTMRVVVNLRESAGPEAYLHFTVKSPPIRAGTSGDQPDATDEHEGITATDESIFVARVGSQTRAREGDSVELLVDTNALHFFDPVSGARIPA
jgi:multiple sugar transport system ATP-binding protein